MARRELICPAVGVLPSPLKAPGQRLAYDTISVVLNVFAKLIGARGA